MKMGLHLVILIDIYTLENQVKEEVVEWLYIYLI